jgi:hypothetical protein
LIFTAVGLLMIYISNYMEDPPQTARWASGALDASDETVWTRAHRVAGYAALPAARSSSRAV